MKKKTYKSKRISGKLKVHHYLLSGEISEHLPETLWLTKKNLEQMITKYNSVYIKPNVGSQGIGVYKVKQEDNGYQLYSTKNKYVFFKGISSLYAHLHSRTKKKLIVQQGIELEELNGSPYDVRVMVQRKPGSAWACTGIVAKVGAPKKIVTNYYQGGKVYTMDSLYKKMNLSEEEIKERIEELKQLALDIARFLHSKQPGMYEMGIDLGYDTEKKLWIIEVNSRMPEFDPIKYVDRSMYNRMLSYAKSYGRKHG